MGITGQSKKTPAEAMASASFAEFSFEGAVTLLVGRSEQKMLAYSSHLIRDSQFFAAAMKKEWVEGQTRTIKLPEEDRATIAHYLSCLYTGKIFTEDITATVGDGIESCFQLLSSLYVCGERFIDPKFQNLVLNKSYASLACPTETECTGTRQAKMSTSSTAALHRGLLAVDSWWTCT